MDDLTPEKDSAREGGGFLSPARFFFSCFLFSASFMNHQLLFKSSQSQLGEKVSPKTYSTACACLKSSQMQGNRTLRVGSPSVGMCVCGGGGGKKACKVKFPPLQLCLESCGGGVCASPPLLLTPPPSLRDCASCFGVCGWEVYEVVCE